MVVGSRCRPGSSKANGLDSVSENYDEAERTFSSNRLLKLCTVLYRSS